MAHVDMTMKSIWDHLTPKTINRSFFVSLKPQPVAISLVLRNAYRCYASKKQFQLKIQLHQTWATLTNRKLPYSYILHLYNMYKFCWNPIKLMIMSQNSILDRLMDRNLIFFFVKGDTLHFVVSIPHFCKVLKTVLLCNK